MFKSELQMRPWVKSTIIAGKLSGNKELIDHSLDCFGGTKTKLAMTILQPSHSKLKDKDSKQESNCNNRSITTAIALLREKAQLTCAGNCKL